MAITIIAEIGSNWDPVFPVDSCTAMIEAAARAGADMVKFQDWHPLEEMPRDDEWKARCGAWTLDPETHTVLQDVAEENRVGFMCSVFTHDAVLRAVGNNERAYIRGLKQRCAFKIASSEMRNQRLLMDIAQRLNPVRCSYPADEALLSLGNVSSPFEVPTAIARLRHYHVTLLACVSEYPVGRPIELLDSLTFAQRFGLPVGVSSHIAYPDCVPIIKQAIGRGAAVVEAHLRVDGVTPENAPDNGPWALWEDEFNDLVDVVRGEEDD